MNALRILANRPALLAAAVAVAAAMAWAVSAETPVGKLGGQVVLQDTGRPMPRVRISLRSQDGKTTRSAITDAEGRFLLTMPSGSYTLVAYSQAHRSQQTIVWVTEGRTSALVLGLARSRPDLQLARHQRVISTSASAVVPVMGYVDSANPTGTTLVVRVYQTRLSPVLRTPQTAEALRRIGDYWQPGTRLPAPLLRSSRPVSTREVVVTDADIEGFYHNQIELGRLRPGLYLVEVSHGSNAVSTWVHVTDLALVLKRAGDEMLAYTAHLQSGIPAPETWVEVYRQGAQLTARGTNHQGMARFKVPQERDKQFLLIASRGEDEAVVGLREYRFEEHGNYAVHLYTDRTVYRPGHRIYYKGIVRRKTAEGMRYAVPSVEQVRLELRDPNRQTVMAERKATNAYGSFFGDFTLSPEAPTGTYSWIVSVGNERHTEDMLVAAYRKPEFTVTVTPERTRVVRGDTVRFTISAEYFFGTPVAGAKVSYSIYRTHDWAYEYSDEFEGDGGMLPNYGAYGRIAAEGKAVLDGQGRATITVRAGDGQNPAQQAERWSIVVSATDASDRYASGEAALRVIAGELRVVAEPEGYIGFPNRATGLAITVTDPDDHRRPLAGIPVEVEYGIEQWGNQSSTRPYNRLGVLQATTGANGRARVELIPSRPGSLRITVRANDASGRVVATFAYLWVVDEREGYAVEPSPSLSVLTDKRRYRPGDTARVAVNTDRTGQTALVTVEGARMHVAHLVALRDRTTVLNIPVRAEYGPNVHLSALYVRDGRLARSSVPLRVSIADSELTVGIAVDRSTARPGDTVSYSVRVRDATGRPVKAELSLGIVDEAVYALREDDPAAVRDAFYPWRESAVRTEWSGDIDYLGQGAEKTEPDVAVRRRFPDTAAWFPTVRTDARGEAAVTVTLPDNLTTWRATAIAHTVDTKVGRGVGSLVVTKDFLVRLDTARFLVQGDRTRVLALIHNNTDAPQTAVVRLQPGALQVEGDADRTIMLEPRQVVEVPWIVTPPGPGEIPIRVLAWTEDKRYTDGVETTLTIRPHGRVVFWNRSGDMTSGSKAENFTVSPSADLRTTRLEVRITPSITTSLVGALEYLFDYPYGCIEQTMGRFVPDVVASGILRSAGIRDSRLEERTRDMVRDGLTRIYRAQNSNGSWGWFFYDEADVWMTSYVLYGLSLAHDHGYAVDEAVLKRGLAAGADFARSSGLPDDKKSFLLYALALAGDQGTARSERRKLSLSGQSSETLAYLVLLDKVLGDDPRPAFAELERRAVQDPGLLHWESSQSNWHWDRRMITALGLRAMLMVNPKDARIGSVLRWLMLERTGAYWESTRATAWVVLALSDYLRLYPETEVSGQIRALVNGKPVGTFPLKNALEGQPEIVLNVPGQMLQSGANNLVLERTTGSNRIFYGAFLHQTIRGDQIPPATSAGLSIEREYLRIRQQFRGETWTLETERTRNRLRTGDNVRVRLTLRLAREVAYVLIEDPLPAGFEVTDRTFNSDVGYDGWQYWWAFADARDDRIAFFVPRLSAGTYTIEYTVRASTPGAYRVLPSSVQAMYNPALRGESADARVEVTD